MRIVLFLLHLILSGAVADGANGQVLSGVFTGKWEQVATENGAVIDSGAITLHMLDHNDRALKGTVRLTNTPRCKDPIPVRGTVSEKNSRTILLESEGSPVCGFSGKLEIKITRVNDRMFTGNYVYRYLGGVWMEGIFTVSPVDSPREK